MTRTGWSATIAVAAVTLSIGGAAGAWLQQRRVPATDAFRPAMLEHLRRLDRGAAAPRVVFLGASTLQGMDIAAISPRGLNLSIGGDTIDGLRARLAGYRAPVRALALVVHIGLNDLRADCHAIDVERWRALLRELPTQSPRLLVGIQGAMAPGCDGRLPSLIAESNAALEAACRSAPPCRFVAHPVAAPPSDAQRALLDVDGVHPSPAGYAVLASRLRESLEAVAPEGVR